MGEMPLDYCSVASVQWRIALNIDPLSRTSRHVTALAICLVVDGGCLPRVVGIEPRPTPAVTPKLVSRVIILAISDHHEPTLKRLFAADGPRRHGSCRRRVNFLDQHSAVWEMSGLSVCRHCARRSVDDVQLFGANPLISRDRPAPKKLVGCSVVRRNTNIAAGIDCSIANNSRPRPRRSGLRLCECGYCSEGCKPQGGDDRCFHLPSVPSLSDRIS